MNPGWPAFEQFLGLAAAILAASPLAAFVSWLWRPRRGDDPC